MIVDAIENVILASPAAAQLATWEFDAGVHDPAVFTTEVIPEDCARPAVIIDDLPGGEWGTRGKRGGECFARVRVYGDKARQPYIVRDIARTMWEAVNRADLNPHLLSYGYRSALCIADLPGYLTDPDGYPGYVMSVRVLVLER